MVFFQFNRTTTTCTRNYCIIDVKLVGYCIIVLKQNKHIQLSTKKKEYRFSTKGPFKGLRVKWQSKQNQIIASMRQTFITVCVKKKRKKTKTKKHQAFYEIICIVDYVWENFTLE